MVSAWDNSTGPRHSDLEPGVNGQLKMDIRDCGAHLSGNQEERPYRFPKDSAPLRYGVTKKDLSRV
jgi:hypothetical protein